MGPNPIDTKRPVIYVKSKDHNGETIQIDPKEYDAEKHTKVDPPKGSKPKKRARDIEHAEDDLEPGESADKDLQSSSDATEEVDEELDGVENEESEDTEDDSDESEGDEKKPKRRKRRTSR